MVHSDDGDEGDDEDGGVGNENVDDEDGESGHFVVTILPFVIERPLQQVTFHPFAVVADTEILENHLNGNQSP